MIDFTKPVQTRDGRTVTILTKEARGTHPIMGYIEPSNQLSAWTLEGRSFGSLWPPAKFDLVNVPERRTAYVNIVKGAKRLKLYRTAQEAASAFDQDGPLIARVKIEYTEGQRDE